MPRSARVDVGGEVYHVINRANGRTEIFSDPSHYKLFEKLLLETKELVDMRILGYILMGYTGTATDYRKAETRNVKLNPL